MTEVTQDIRQLQRLDKVDLVSLLGQLEEELEKLETSNAKTKAENNVLDMRNKELFEQNQALSAQLQQTNQCLVENKIVTTEWQDMKECIRLVAEANKQMREDMRGMREAYEGLCGQLATSSGNIFQEMRHLLEESQKQNEEALRQRDKVNMQLLSDIQQAIAQASNRYGEMKRDERVDQPLKDQKVKSETDDLSLSAQQSRMVERVLNRVRAAEET